MIDDDHFLGPRGPLVEPSISRPSTRPPATIFPEFIYTGIHALWIIRSLIKPTRWPNGIPQIPPWPPGNPANLSLFTCYMISKKLVICAWQLNHDWYDMAHSVFLKGYVFIISSVRSSNSHPDLLLTHHHQPLFQITPVLNTGLAHSEPLQLNTGYNAI